MASMSINLNEMVRNLPVVVVLSTRFLASNGLTLRGGAGAAFGLRASVLGWAPPMRGRDLRRLRPPKLAEGFSSAGLSADSSPSPLTSL